MAQILVITMIIIPFLAGIAYLRYDRWEALFWLGVFIVNLSKYMGKK